MIASLLNRRKQQQQQPQQNIPMPMYQGGGASTGFVPVAPKRVSDEVPDYAKIDMSFGSVPWLESRM